jgi:hypothetical protein
MPTTLGITWHKINVHDFYFILFYHDTWWDQPRARYGIIVKNNKNNVGILKNLNTSPYRWVVPFSKCLLVVFLIFTYLIIWCLVGDKGFFFNLDLAMFGCRLVIKVQVY